VPGLDRCTYQQPSDKPCMLRAGDSLTSQISDFAKMNTSQVHSCTNKVSQRVLSSLAHSAMGLCLWQVLIAFGWTHR